MKFGIFVFGDNHPELGRSNQKYYQEVLTLAEWAEDLGFDSFWLGEHHLYWYGTCVSPPMVIAALAQRTKKIRLGPAVAVPSFHNPLVLAEEYAFADNLCGGRLEFALGSGFSPVEFKTFGMTMEEAKERFWEATDVILKAWAQEEFSHEGKYYHYDNATLYVKPVQKPMPPIWLAASSDETLVKAGQLGWPMMGIPFARSNNLLDVKVKNDLYKDYYVSPAIGQSQTSWSLCTCICMRMREKLPGSAVPTSTASPHSPRRTVDRDRRSPISTSSSERASLSSLLHRKRKRSSGNMRKPA